MKWTIHVFWSMVGYSIANVLTLYNIHEHPAQPMTMQQAVRGIAMGIFDQVEKLPIASATAASKNLHEWFTMAEVQSEMQDGLDETGFLPLPLPHISHPSSVGAKRQCAECKKRPVGDSLRTSKTTHYCDICKVPLHVQPRPGLHHSCWDLYHGFDA